MKAKKEGLQNFTESRFEKILEKKLSYEVLDELVNGEREAFLEYMNKKMNSLKGQEFDKFWNQIKPIADKSTKNQIWENNHLKITISISKQIEETGKMPTKNQIAENSGLSRQTVYNHLSGYAEHPLYAEQLKQFKFMADRVLAKLIKLAVQGDVKAARLYFDVIGDMNCQTTNKTLIKTQNNFIQINGKVLSQEAVKQLNPEQLEVIENILNTALPQPETLSLK